MLPRGHHDVLRVPHIREGDDAKLVQMTSPFLD